VVMHGLDAVTVGVEDERAVIIGPVQGPRPGRAVVAVTRGCQHTPELVDMLARGRDECNVQGARHRTFCARTRDREVVPLEEMTAEIGLSELELREGGDVELLRNLEIRDSDRYVVEHSRQLRA